MSEFDFDFISSCLKKAKLKVRTTPKDAISLAESALKHAQDFNHNLSIARSKSVLGSAYIWLYQFEQAQQLLLEALKDSRALKDVHYEVDTLYMLGILNMYLYNSEDHKTYCFEGLEIARKYQYHFGEAMQLNGIALFYSYTDAYDQAIEYYNSCIQISNEYNLQLASAHAYNGLADVYLKLDNPQKALELKEKSLEISEKEGSNQIHFYILLGIGKIYAHREQYDLAIEYYLKSKTFRIEMGFQSGVAESDLYMSCAYLALNDLDQSLKHAKIALELSKTLEHSDFVYKSHEALSKIAEQQEDFHHFSKHYKSFVDHKQIYIQNKTALKRKETIIKQKIDLLNTERAQLKEEKEIFEELKSDINLLSKIGQTLTSSLDLNHVFQNTYTQVNQLMDANIFLIGLIDHKDAFIDIRFGIENNLPIPRIKHYLYEDNRIGVWVVNNQQEAIINDATKDYEKYMHRAPAEPSAGERAKSIIYLPIFSDDKIVGILSVQSFTKNAYTEYHLGVLRNIAVYAGIAIRNASEFGDVAKQVERRTKQIENQNIALERAHEDTKILNKIGQDLISTFNLDSVFLKLQEDVNKLMDASSFGIRVYNETENSVIYKYQYENGRREQKVVVVSMDQKNNYSVWTILNQKPLLINDNSKDYKKYIDQVQTVAGDFPYSLIFQPLIKGDKVLGAITVQSFERHAYTERHLNILKALASYVVIALSNATAYEVMEKQIVDRTAQLKKQRDIIEMNVIELSKQSKNILKISEIGQKITAKYTYIDIIEEIYQHIGEIMTADSIGIGILNKTETALHFPGYIEHNKRKPTFDIDLNVENSLALKSFQEGRVILITDYEKEAYMYINKDERHLKDRHNQSLIFIPFYIKKEKVGVITVQSVQKRVYNVGHVNFLKNLTVFIGVAIENARLYNSLEAKVFERTNLISDQKDTLESNYQRIKKLNRVGRSLISAVDLNEIYIDLFDKINPLLTMDRFGIRLLSPDKKHLIYTYEIEKGKRLEEFKVSMSDKDNYAVWCVLHKKKVHINNSNKESKTYISSVNTLAGVPKQSLIFQPLIRGEEILGVVTAQADNTNAYSNFHIEVMETLASYLVIAINNSKKNASKLQIGHNN